MTRRPCTRFNIHFLRTGACIWRLYVNETLIARSPKGLTFKFDRAAKAHAKSVLRALQTLNLG